MDYISKVAMDLGWAAAAADLDPEPSKQTTPTYKIEVNSATQERYLIHHQSKSRIKVVDDLQVVYDNGCFGVTSPSGKVARQPAAEYRRLTPPAQQPPDMIGHVPGLLQLGQLVTRAGPQDTAPTTALIAQVATTDQCSTCSCPSSSAESCPCITSSCSSTTIPSASSSAASCSNNAGINIT